MSRSQRYDAFVVATPGLEQLVLTEVVALGVHPAKAVRGGIECGVTLPQLWAMNLRLRVATRVVVRVTRFRADGFDSLASGLARVDWSAWLPEGPIDVRASCDRSSALYHSTAVAERVVAAIGRPAADGAQSLLVRVLDDVVTVSIDASGPSLHQRGWRGPAGRAPLRETLAAALVMSSGWDRRSPIIDPFCGSGTVLVEAAMLARRMAPGRHRSFAFERWPSFDAAGWQRLLDGADSDVVERCPPLIGSDRDRGAVDAALANIATAGLADRIEVSQRAVSDVVTPKVDGRRGWVMCNPPYGERLGRAGAGPRELVPLFDRFGAVLAQHFAGWQVAMLVPDDVPVGHTRLSFEPVLRTSNGGIPVAVKVAAVPLP